MAGKRQLAVYFRHNLCSIKGKIPPPFSHQLFSYTMKVPFLALLTLFTLFACQRPIPPAQANEIQTRYQTADNVTARPKRIEAQFEGGIWAAVYTGGGASICLPGGATYEIEGGTFPDVDGSLICSDSKTGDYLHIFTRSGRGTAKIAGRMFYLFPPNQTNQ